MFNFVKKCYFFICFPMFPTQLLLFYAFVGNATVYDSACSKEKILTCTSSSAGSKPSRTVLFLESAFFTLSTLALLLTSITAEPSKTI